MRVGAILLAAIGFYGVLVWGALLVAVLLELGLGPVVPDCSVASPPCSVGGGGRSSWDYYLIVLSGFGLALHFVMGVFCRRLWASSIRRELLICTGIAAALLSLASNGAAVVLALSPAILALWMLVALPGPRQERT